MTAILFIAMILVMLFSAWASFRVKGNFKKYSSVAASSGLTGAQAADQMLRHAGVTDVRIERTGGTLTDHYDPRAKVIRLSDAVYSSRSVAALGVACHEAGHALQDKERYAALVLRNLAVPVASFGSNAGITLVFFGMILGAAASVKTIGFPIAVLGVVLFAATVIFQIINLPVEFDASARAKRVLVDQGIVSRGGEEQAVSKVLNAAALTYVAATIGAIVTLLYYVALLSNARSN